MKYTVRFHFPNTSLSIEDVNERDALAYNGCVREGHVFEIARARKRYVINPALVTYIEFTEDTPL